jgi:hypothetical protein
MIVRDDGAERITGVHFADLATDNASARVPLTIVGQVLTPAQQQIALQIFRSVRFAQ